MWYFLLFLLVLIATVFLLPFKLKLNTQKEYYIVGWGNLLQFQVVPEEANWRLYLKIAWWERELHLKASKKSNAAPRKKSSKGKSAFSPAKGWALFKNLLRSIRVKKMEVNWDFHDYVFNAYMYPVFHQLSKGKRKLYVNFAGTQAINLCLQTNLFRIARAFWQTFIHPKIFRT